MRFGKRALRAIALTLAAPPPGRAAREWYDYYLQARDRDIPARRWSDCVKNPHEALRLRPSTGTNSADLRSRVAKGCSVIMYRSKDIRKYQIFACTDATAYTLINPTVLSTKSGGPMAGAWAILNFLGEEGYMKIIKEVQVATRKLIDGINTIPGLRVLGEPAMCMFSFASNEVNVYHLADEMNKRGWYIQGQFSTPLTPRNLHISVNHGTVHNVDALLKDLRRL